MLDVSVDFVRPKEQQNIIFGLETVSLSVGLSYLIYIFIVTIVLNIPNTILYM